ncbi:RES domain-containing protein [Cryobacterium algoritolerans]|uniref:RES domain-containing protein n=1 Tax=Cryobacterium algoritolerans TaxID=1259184 RepID=A0A4R8WWH9_9MICO|nr:RES family NAD+ phosphorylase [Cryobacterium algoritolerans]TFC19717.1 RES domain-containing protein [Cryobacterium algoritolerans]
MVDLTSGRFWKKAPVRLYKWTPAGILYDPVCPWPSLGRFGSGQHKTLYLAETAKGALAEYFRRHPELLSFQTELVISMYEIDLNIQRDCLDLRDLTDQTAIGASADFLVSTDPDEGLRYAECRLIAESAVAEGIPGIVYPSAAANWPRAWNIVFLGEQDDVNWSHIASVLIPCPEMLSSEVHVLA